MPVEGSQRIDKWLFFTRAAKSRSLAAKLVQSGAIRVNGTKIEQPAHAVKPGDGVTIRLERRVLVWQVVAPGKRRGPAEEARTLYADLTPPPESKAEAPVAERDQGAGRPTKRERRDIDRLQGGE
jgi:ribosome-associated heat shock protein Hsp15